jgi:dTDP-4-dehydrorhamnose 3,5-epimerase
MLKIIPTAIDGAVIIEPTLFPDERGYFFESYNAREFAAAGLTATFVQDNESQSTFGVIRGLHYQLAPAAQTKLVRASQGKIWDVIVDLRRPAPSFRQIVRVELSAENQRQLWVPRGCAHGFAVLSATATVTYKCDNFYDPSAARGIFYADPELAIDWQLPAAQVIVAAKDRTYPPWHAAEF